MKAKLVKEAFKDVFKPQKDYHIRGKIKEILGEDLGSWVANLPDYRIEDYVIYSSTGQGWIEFSVPNKDGLRYLFYVSYNKKEIKVCPPYSSILSRSIHMDSEEELQNFVNDWITKKYANAEAELKKISDYNFPED